MKKIIDGKKYDTETAEKVATWWNGRSSSDFNFCQEAVYRKKNGEFFLAGEGGARSKYAVSCGQNAWCGGSDIAPLTEAEARAWVEDHANSEYENIFGPCAE